MSPSDRLDPTESAPAFGVRARLALIVMWCSFLAASIATVVFFAFVDPAPDALPDRTALYSVGFLFFWAVCALAATLTAWLLAPSRSASP